MSKAEKQRSHSRILDAAALLFRENGIGATSVSDVMKTAGMTHGGFYRHFASKEDLVEAAFSHAVDGVVADMERESTVEGRKRSRQAYVSKYLSQEHVEDRSHGCPLAAMGAELARTGNAHAQAGARAVARMAALLQNDPEGAPDQGLAEMALLLGTITLARLADTRDEATQTLKTGQIAVRLLQDHWH
ncbi:MAG: helix-turn-helix domain-containing protein [Pseudomonadota bacterium]